MVVLRGECKNVGKWICETDLFETYITEHLAKYAGIWKRKQPADNPLSVRWT